MAITRCKCACPKDDHNSMGCKNCLCLQYVFSELQTFGRADPSYRTFTVKDTKDQTLTYRGSGSDLATDIKAMLHPDEIARLIEALK